MTESSGAPGMMVLGGCGHLGRRIAEELMARGYRVVVIDTAPPPSGTTPGYDWIVGDIREDETLRRAGITEARCLLAVTGDDSTNLEAAITARALVPDLRAVVRIYDQSLAQSLESAFGVQALSAAYLALPAYISAATEDTVLASFEIDGQYLTLDPADRTDLPQRLAIARDGARFAVADSPASTALYATLGGLNEASSTARHRRRVDWGEAIRRAGHACRPSVLWHGARQTWGRASIITRRLLLTLLVMIAVSVTIFATAGHLSVLDALYFVVTTFTTTGYGDINLQSAPPWLKVYGILMMLCGATLLATLYAIISDFVLTARVEYLLGRRGTQMDEHCVVVGLGKIGYRVARALSAQGLPVVAVEANAEIEHLHAARMTMPVIVGDAARGSVMEHAGVSRARAILALTDDPMLNLRIALLARQRQPAIRTVVRTYEARFADKLRNFALDAIVSTSAITAPIFANAATYPGVEGSFRLDGEDVLVVRHAVQATSPLANRRVAEAGTEQGIAVVLARSPGATTFHLTDPPETLPEGTIVICLVSRANLAALSHYPKPAPTAPQGASA